MSTQYICENAKDTIRNVHYFRKQEKEKRLKISLNQAKERTSTMNGVSKSTIKQLMEGDNTTEEKPEQPRTKRVHVDDEHVLSVERVYMLKEIVVEEEHDPVVSGLASDSDWSSDTDTCQPDREHVKLNVSEI